MIGRTNAGSGKSVALIRVLYNAGTVCTCSNGVITFGSDISGDYLFELPSVGNWTVSGVDSKGVAKSVTLTIAKGDGKLVTLDTMIPPEYRTTYQEVEYLEFSGTGNKRGWIELGMIIEGSWDFEMENLMLDYPTSDQKVALGTANDNLFFSYYNDRFRLTTSQSDLVANKAFPLTVPHNIQIHWSSVSESKPVVLTIDGEEVASSTTTRWLGNKPILRAGYGDGGGYQWNGKYGPIKIKQEGTLVRHFIPCKRRLDGMPGYFNLLDNQFTQGSNDGDLNLADVLLVINPGPGIGD